MREGVSASITVKRCRLSLFAPAPAHAAAASSQKSSMSPADLINTFLMATSSPLSVSPAYTDPKPPVPSLSMNVSVSLSKIGTGGSELIERASMADFRADRVGTAEEVDERFLFGPEPDA